MSRFSVASVFSDHCVLQRGKRICVFGEGEDGTPVSVALRDKDNRTISENSSVVRNGKWRVYLSPVAENTGLRLEISSNSDRKEFSDVAVGEVWLAGGQSNMEFELGNCTEGPEEMKLPSNPLVRFYYTQKIAWKDEAFYESEKNTCWQTWDSEWRKAWSAVGYFFAKRVAEKLGITVGIIGCNWGGTSATCWVDRTHLEKDADLRTYLDEYDEAVKGKSFEEQCREHDEYVAKNDVWQKKSAEIYAKNPNTDWNDVLKLLGPCPWPGPMNCKNQYRPNGLYDCMITRVEPYTLRGFLWYQGANDDHKPYFYEKLLKQVIDQWRTDWGDLNLPFIIAQLPEHRYTGDRDYKNWCLLREAQFNVWRTVRNTGMVCGLGLGEYNDIHPKHKRVMGFRMADSALGFVYKKAHRESVENAYPCEFYTEGGKCIISFRNAPDGFVFKDDTFRTEKYRYMESLQKNILPEKITGFEVAGKDGVFYPAECAFDKTPGCENRITVTSEKVQEPFYVRYAWYNYGPVTFFTKNGLPVTPFRLSLDGTFPESGATGHAEVQQTMEVG